MMHDALHLTMDDVDALLEGHLEVVKLRHLEICDACREFAQAEQRLAARLAALPLLSPREGFADRVMIALRPGAVPVPLAAAQSVRQRLFGTRRRLAVAAGLSFAVLGSMAGSVAWSLGNPDTLAEIGRWVTTQGGQALWVTLRGLATNLFEQPWYSDARSALGSPERVAVVTGSLTLAYLTGVLTLKRLLKAPASGLVRANA